MAAMTPSMGLGLCVFVCVCANDSNWKVSLIWWHYPEVKSESCVFTTQRPTPPPPPENENHTLQQTRAHINSSRMLRNQPESSEPYDQIL